MWVHARNMCHIVHDVLSEKLRILIDILLGAWFSAMYAGRPKFSVPVILGYNYPSRDSVPDELILWELRSHNSSVQKLRFYSTPRWLLRQTSRMKANLTKGKVEKRRGQKDERKNSPLRLCVHQRNDQVIFLRTKNLNSTSVRITLITHAEQKVTLLHVIPEWPIAKSRSPWRPNKK
jgi:hypothetical protein